MMKRREKTDKNRNKTGSPFEMQPALRGCYRICLHEKVFLFLTNLDRKFINDGNIILASAIIVYTSANKNTLNFDSDVSIRVSMRQ
jgi:hypothetical protein